LTRDGASTTQLADAVRQVRSNGNRHAFGAMSWWIAFGPHEPGW